MVVAFGQPDSVSKVVAAIRNFGKGVSQKEIIAATGLSERTVKYALKKLGLCGMISASNVISDLRRKIFYFGGEKNGNQ